MNQETIMSEQIFDDASKERERQRSESEARAIIHDLDKLYTFEEEKKTRWIWELLQNAKDVATSNGVDILVKLTKDELIFSHNGHPFKTTHLLALLYKTSTKSLNGEDGTTGKYGTGFVTTHLLSQKLNISGIHENNAGTRRFDLTIDRTISNCDENSALLEMQKTLTKAFESINNISMSPSETLLSEWNSFIYPLSTESFTYAARGVEELERNLAFTLLINPKIKSISIEKDNLIKKYTAIPEETFLNGISFLSTNSDTGILFAIWDKLTIAISAKKSGENFTLLPIEGQAILYKEFPLIGTENFNLPVFIQHSDFHPTEQRDGIRSKKMSEGEDPIADKNRTALCEFVVHYLQFIKTIIEGQVDNAYLFAESGLPQHVERFSDIDWYQHNIQTPIREFILQQKIVKTALGNFKKIGDVLFPTTELFNNDSFYSLVSELVPDSMSERDSIWRWCEIVAQEPSSWPTDISIDLEEMVKLVPENLKKDSTNGIKWLKLLYAFLETNNANHWGEKYPVYLNETNDFCLRDKVSIHPEIDEEFKIVSKGLGRSLDAEFLNKKLGAVSSIKEFDLREFFVFLNKEMISELKAEKANEEQVKAILHVCTLFRSEKSSKREKWYDLLKKLLPNIIVDKKQISVEYDNYWRSAEIWSIKYICSLIENSQTPTAFAAQYFQSDITITFEWLKGFLGYVFQLEDDNKEVFLKRSIIPTESNIFKSFDDFIFAEEETKYFNDTIKDIYRDYTKKGDPRSFIIDRRVFFDGLRTRDVSILTDEIDKLFQEPNVETKIKTDESYNKMFLQLNDWFEKFPDATAGLRTFGATRASNYVLALGEGFSKQIIEMQSSGRSIEEITELAKIQLTNKQIQQFEQAAQILGADKLLEKAKEMLDAKAQVERWKVIGNAAESAFKEAVAGLDFEYEIENPDRGRDFDLIINTKGYSIEIKSVAEGKENVKMSILQGRTAVVQKENYALCVVTRPANEDVIVDMVYFMANSRFVTDIGYQIGDKINNWDEGLQLLQFSSEIKVQLEDKTESVYVNRNIWRTGISFQDFVLTLKKLASGNASN